MTNNNTLKRLRIELALSQIELAMAANVPRYVIQLAEQAISLPTHKQQFQIAAALGVKPEDLFGAASVAKKEVGNV